MTNPIVDVSTADFTTVRQNLVNYLQNQSEFSDYVFTGSALSLLIDILSYNTCVNAAYANLAFSETFLDTAVQRGSVVSRAKEMGYVPRSITASKATISISFSVSGNPAQFTIPQGTAFHASINGTTYPFVTNHDCLIENIGNVFTQNITVYQGQYNHYTYTVNTSNAAQRFIIPSVLADTSTLTVLFKQNAGISTWTQWNPIDSYTLGEIEGTTPVYFLKEAYDGYFELYFGDGVLGQELTTNNVIQLQYLLTSGDAANGANVFTLATALGGVSGVSITTINAAAGGQAKETVDSIKFTAPLFDSSNGRAVTANDYTAIIKNKYSNVGDVKVWGGENNIPPYYGKVFAAIAPVTGGVLSPTEKLAIQNDITEKFNLINITPTVVDPDYITVNVSTVITYDALQYSTTSNINLISVVEASIQNFFATSANKFGQTVYYSQLVEAINNSSSLIVDNITNITLSQSLDIFTGISGNYDYRFNNAINPGSVLSNAFSINNITWYIKDITTGMHFVNGDLVSNLVVYYIDGQGNPVYYSNDIGTVNYNTGEISIKNLPINYIVSDPIGGQLTIQVAPGPLPNENDLSQVYIDNNIYCNGLEQIITLNQSGINVTLLSNAV